MARTGTNENKTANQQMSAIQQDQIKRANAATDAYNANLGKLEAAGNPYDYSTKAGGEYLKNWNTLTGSAASAENKAADESIEQASKRTGLNSASTPYLKAELGRQKARDMSTLGAQRQQEDQANAIDYQKWLLGARLAPAGVDTSMFSTATNGRNAALGNLTQLGLASYGPMNALISGAAGAAGAALGNPSGFGGCWIAEAIYGINDPRTHLMRYWLNNVWAKRSLLGAAVMKAYLAVGQQVAKQVRKHEILKSIFKPVFDYGLKHAEAWASAMEVR